MPRKASGSRPFSPKIASTPVEELNQSLGRLQLGNASSRAQNTFPRQRNTYAGGPHTPYFGSGGIELPRPVSAPPLVGAKSGRRRRSSSASNRQRRGSSRSTRGKRTPRRSGSRTRTPSNSADETSFGPEVMIDNSLAYIQGRIKEFGLRTVDIQNRTKVLENRFDAIESKAQNLMDLWTVKSPVRNTSGGARASGRFSGGVQAQDGGFLERRSNASFRSQVPRSDLRAFVELLRQRVKTAIENACDDFLSDLPN